MLIFHVFTIIAWCYWTWFKGDIHKPRGQVRGREVIQITTYLYIRIIQKNCPRRAKGKSKFPKICPHDLWITHKEEWISAKLKQPIFHEITEAKCLLCQKMTHCVLLNASLSHCYDLIWQNPQNHIFFKYVGGGLNKAKMDFWWKKPSLYSLLKIEQISHCIRISEKLENL